MCAPITHTNQKPGGRYHETFNESFDDQRVLFGFRRCRRRCYISASEAVKTVEQKGGSDVLSLDFLKNRKGGPYYRITVDNTPSGERKEVFVDARTGKINGVIEHSASMVGDTPAVR